MPIFYIPVSLLKQNFALQSSFITLNSFTQIIISLLQCKKGERIYSRGSKTLEVERTAAGKLWERTEITSLTRYDKKEKRAATLVADAKPSVV